MPNISIEHPILTEEEKIAREEELKNAIRNLLKEKKEDEENNQ